MSITEPRTNVAATIKGVDLVAYVRDPDRAIAFYRDVLGMTPTEFDEQGRGAEFTLATARPSACGDPTMARRRGAR